MSPTLADWFVFVCAALLRIGRKRFWVADAAQRRAELVPCLGTRRLISSSQHVRFNEENHYNHARLAAMNCAEQRSFLRDSMRATSPRPLAIVPEISTIDELRDASASDDSSRDVLHGQSSYKPTDERHAMDKSAKKFFQQILETPSPSGYEQPVQEIVRQVRRRFRRRGPHRSARQRDRRVAIRTRRCA